MQSRTACANCNCALDRHEKEPEELAVYRAGRYNRAKFSHTARMTAAELAQEIAILLYEKEKLTLGQASQLAQMSQSPFQFLLASRQIPIHYGVAEFEADLQTLRDMGRL
jgi:predicted HTH domain antitoxin